MGTVSRNFLAATIHRCRWLPCPAAVADDFIDTPAVLGGWCQDVEQHVLIVADVRKQPDTHTMLECGTKLSLPHPGSITDLQVARIEDNILVATSSSTGSVCMLLMQLPPVPQATSADLQFVAVSNESVGDSDEDDALQQQQQQQPTWLHEVPDLHDVPASSVDINSTRQSILSVAGDGSICIVPLADVDQGGGDQCQFKSATGWSGYSHARWTDSQTFATAGVLGGLQLWDVRQGAKAIRCSPLTWGPTGCAALDNPRGPSRQLLCLDVHPSRPNMAATGASGGAVALWDLRFTSAPLTSASPPQAAGDVWEVKFDPCEPLMTSAVAPVPPLLYCTSDGALCHAAAARKSSSSSGGNWGQQLGANSLLQSTAMQQLPCAINSFDIEPSFGQDIMAVTDFEGMLLLHRAIEA